MNAAEVGKLLGLMALADNRKAPEDDNARRALIAFWLKMVGDLTYPDCAQAVETHYRESRDWIMPSDVRRRVGGMHAERLRLNPPPPVPAELTDDQAAYREALLNGRRRVIEAPSVDRKAIGGTP
jgi:hypothetical protein